ncbi:fatty acid CoA ligase family protein [Planctomicrobium sp. SH661]|uniref:fatty acid CoA ligase family protein n=1 Tax=Planctomicrobium sp. SH661 TaxID=3448124 RepID=UPI003F5C7837
MNIALRLTEMARKYAQQRAIVAPQGRDAQGRVRYREMTFAQLDEESTRIAAGLRQRGLIPGMKLVLFAPFGIEMISLTFALFKAGAIVVLIDPGMGRRNIFNCLKEVKPDGFVAIPAVHLIRLFSGRELRRTRFNICVGPRLPGTLATYRQLVQSQTDGFVPVQSQSRDAAAVIFTSGSTGAPKGVLYEHGMFDAQVDLIRDFYGIQPGDVDLPGFPLFGLFNAAMGVTTVIPDMDPTRPAQVDPKKIIEAINDQTVTQAFGSPAFWNRVGRFCTEHNITLPTLKRALSAGGPVPVHVLERMSKILTRPGADLFTPYGATESLPVSSISASDVLQRTAPLTRTGKGTCVGRPFPGVRVKIIEITDGPVRHLSEVKELPAGEIGEIIASGPSVTREYYQRPEATALAKIPDGDAFWHRIGDVGSLTPQGELWFCGRKAHIVETAGRKMFSVCCEAIFNEHPRIYRCALVGVGSKPNQQPVIVAEPEAGEFPKSEHSAAQLRSELLALARANPLTEAINEILFHHSLPVDTRHNVKINREQLAIWAAERLHRPSR